MFSNCSVFKLLCVRIGKHYFWLIVRTIFEFLVKRNCPVFNRQTVISHFPFWSLAFSGHCDEEESLQLIVSKCLEHLTLMPVCCCMAFVCNGVMNGFIF